MQSGGGVWPEQCVQGSWGAQLYPDLRVAGEVVRKGQGGEDGYSGLTVRDPVTGEEAATPSEELLRRRGVRQVVMVVGLATDYGNHGDLLGLRGCRPAAHGTTLSGLADILQ